MLRHLATCVAATPSQQGEGVVQFRVDMIHSPFWIDVEVKERSTLRQFDRFLREIWLECCGHLSAFEIGRIRYDVGGDEDFHAGRNELTMDVTVAQALAGAPKTFSYEYDFGSTTQLRLQEIAHFQAPKRRAAVRLLARNDAPQWVCGTCSGPAEALCAYCVDEGDPFVCDAHMEDHLCGDEAMRPIVNSPRMGVCGYSGEI